MKSGFISAMCKEIVLNGEFFSSNSIDTLYFGGGTPSALSIQEMKTIFDSIAKYVDISSINEITMEVNPDDVSMEYIDGLIQLGVNRISMGVQSFYDDHLRKMNRRHNAQQAFLAIEIIKKSAINNVSIDLIYGLPYMNMEQWTWNIEQAIKADVQHISAYHLTFEKGTVYYDLLKKGTLSEISEEDSSEQFDYLRDKLQLNGFENYEISNFSKAGYYSQHNSSYWTGEKYLGLGPSAHSFDGKIRRWNVRDLNRYTQSVVNDKVYWEEEELTLKDIYNERIMLGLRTSKGFSMDYINSLTEGEIKEFAQNEIVNQLNKGNVEVVDNHCRVKHDRKFICDRIIASLFFTDDD